VLPNRGECRRELRRELRKPLLLERIGERTGGGNLPGAVKRGQLHRQATVALQVADEYATSYWFSYGEAISSCSTNQPSNLSGYMLLGWLGIDPL